MSYETQTHCPRCHEQINVIRLCIFNHGPKPNVYKMKMRECGHCGYKGYGQILGGYDRSGTPLEQQ